MTKKQLKKALAPVKDGHEVVKVWLEHSNDDKEASIRFKSNVPMTALMLIQAGADFINDLAEQAYFNAKGDVPPSVQSEGEH